jgi:hypothetical protein
MADKITLKDKNSHVLYPQTIAEHVKDASGITLDRILSDLKESVSDIHIGGTNIYQGGNSGTDFYLTSTGEMKYTRFYDLTPEAKRNLRGQNLTVSFDYILENAVMSRNSTGYQFSVKYTDGTQTIVQGMMPAEATAVTKSGRISFTTKIEDKEIADIISFQPYLYVQTTSGTATVGRPKFEIGTKATQWSPAPEEMARKSDLVNITIDITPPTTFKDGDVWLTPLK